MANPPKSKDTFIVRKKYQNQVSKLTKEQKADLLDRIFEYQSTGRYEEASWWVDMLLSIMVDERKKDEERYEEVCKKNKETALEREKKKREKQEKKTKKQAKHDRAQPCTKDTKSTDNECDSDYDSDSECEHEGVMLKEISSNDEIEQSSFWNPEINNLIEQIKQECDSLGVAYDKQKERIYAKNILTAKAYWEFCEKIWQTRVQFALNVLIASVKAEFRKWPRAWPMTIYQDYADVYNYTKKQHSKNQKNLIQSF